MDEPDPIGDKWHGYNPDQLRALLISNHLPRHMVHEASQWLGAWDARERVRTDLSNAEHKRLALKANAIAKQARNAARAALVVATISAIVGIAALFIR